MRSLRPRKEKTRVKGAQAFDSSQAWRGLAAPEPSSVFLPGLAGLFCQETSGFPEDTAAPLLNPGNHWIPRRRTALHRAPVTFTTGSIGSHLEAGPAIREAAVGSQQVHAALSLSAEVAIPCTLVHIWGRTGAGAA